MNIHKQELVTNNLPLDELKGYITYCRTQCSPKLTEAAAKKLADYFVEIRQRVRDKRNDDNNNESEEETDVPITVRQLEAIVRISEAVAKMTMSDIADDKHVDEAIRLFTESTLNSATTQKDEHKKKKQTEV